MVKVSERAAGARNFQHRDPSDDEPECLGAATRAEAEAARDAAGQAAAVDLTEETGWRVMASPSRSSSPMTGSAGVGSGAGWWLVLCVWWRARSARRNFGLRPVNGKSATLEISVKR